MGVLFDDKHRPRRSKMLSSYDDVDNVERMTNELKRFISGKPVDEDIPREQILTTINPDEGCVFSPEAYLSNLSPDTAIRVVDRAIGLEGARRRADIMANGPITTTIAATSRFRLRNLIEHERTAPLKALKDYPEGRIPIISATYYENGIQGWREVPPELRLRDYMTISKTHNTRPCEAFWHPYEFSAIGTVHIVKPIADFCENELAMIYLCQAITESNAWRYNYARTVKLHEIEVYLPCVNGRPDMDAITAIGRNQMSS